MVDGAREVLVWGGGRVGDVVMTFPALKIIRSRLPGRRLTYVTSDYAEEVIRASGLADEVYTLKFRGGLLNLLRCRRLSRRVAAGAFEWTFVLGSAAKYRGWIGPLEGTVRSDTQNRGHQAERSARAVIAALGLGDVPIPPPRLDVPDRPEIAERLRCLGVDVGSDRYLVVHATCNRVMRHRGRGRPAAKCWPLDRYAPLIGRLAMRFPSLKTVLVGTVEEQPLIRSHIEANLKGRASVVDLCGKTAIADLLQLLKHTALLLCVDSGVMHLGTVVGAPMVVLFGITDEGLTGPFGMGERASLIRGIPLEKALQDPACMEAINVDRVYEVAERRLAEEGVTDAVGRTDGPRT